MLTRTTRYLTLMLLATATAPAGDWLHFGADAVLSGRTTSETRLDPASVAGLEERWGKGCDDIWFAVISRSPAIRDGVLYTSEAGGPLSALDARTGALLWQFGGTTSGWAPQPVVTENGTVLYLEGSYPTELLGVDGGTGAQLWQAPLGFDMGFNDTAVPIVDEGRGLVYLVESPFMGDGKVWAFHLDSGEVAWYAGQATHGVGFKGDYVLLHGDRLYVVGIVEEDYYEADRVLALDAATQQMVASFPRPEDIDIKDISRISVCSGQLMVNYCDRDDVFESEGILVAHDLTTGVERWRFDPGTAITGQLACNEGLGRVYVPTEPYLYALDASSGSEEWRYMGYSPIYSPSLANGVLYMLSDTNLYALDEATGERLFRYGLSELAYDTTQVAIADTMVFFSGNGGRCDLYALGLPGDNPAGAIDGVIPAAASNPGAAGTFWGTTVWAFQDDVAQATLTLRAGNETVTAEEVAPVTVTLARAQVVRLDDVLARFPEITPPAALFYSWDGVDPRRAALASRTFTPSPGGAAGTLGQGIPGIDVTTLPGPDESQIVPLSPDEAQARSNLGVANAGTAAAAVVVRIRSKDGAVLGEHRFQLPGGGWRQLSRVFDVLGVAPAPLAYAEVVAEGSKTAGTPRLAVYSSLVDNTSGDPTYLAAQRQHGTGSELIIPVAAHNPGAAGTQWVTDISSVNWGGRDGSVCAFTFLAEGVSNHPSPANSRSLTADANEHLYLPDVVLNLYGESNRKGAVAATTLSELRWSRTYNSGGAGTYGQGLPGLEVESHRISGAAHGLLVGLEESSSFRTNIGLVNTSTEVTTVSLVLSTASGTQIGTLARTLLPRSMEQIAAPFAAFGGVVDGSASVTSDHGVIAYASVVDNTTGDATTVLARRVQ